MPDVEMKPAASKGAANDDKKDAEEKPAIPETPVDEIKANAALIERGVSTIEPRFTHRALRTLTGLRKKLDETILNTVIEAIYPKGA